MPDDWQMLAFTVNSLHRVLQREGFRINSVASCNCLHAGRLISGSKKWHHADQTHTMGGTTMEGQEELYLDLHLTMSLTLTGGETEISLTGRGT